MALPRSLSFLRQGTGPQALEVYLDPLCPFCAKAVRSIDTNVLPLIAKGGKYEGKLCLISRIYPQPFHYLSTYHSEAILVVGQKYPTIFWKYLLAVFETQKTYFNVPSQDLTASQTRDQLVDIALGVMGKQGSLQGPKSKVYGELWDALEVKQGADGGTNGGNEATLGLKHCIKMGRQNGVHVTPTVMFDGLKEDTVSSSWGKDEWEKFLSQKMSE